MLQDREPIRHHGAEEPRAGIDGQAEDDIKYIRQVMASATTFTAVPGKGMLGMGVVAILAALGAFMLMETTQWIWPWMVAAVVAPVIGFSGLLMKARKTNLSLYSGVGWKFLMSLMPAMFAGLVVSLALWTRNQDLDLLPGIWMLLYGVGATTGGIYSVRVIPLMGACFIVAGVIGLFTPLVWSNLLLALSFGGVHLVFGYLIVKHYGG